MNTKTLLRLSLATVLISVLMASCASLKPLDARYVKVTPQPLVLQGGVVPATITLDLPAKWFKRNAEVRITPVLRYAGGEVAGTTTTLQGEKVRGNGIEVSYTHGGKIDIQSLFRYNDAMQKSDLYLTFVARVGSKTVKLPDLKVGTGVIATEALADSRYATPAIAPDGFQRIIKERYDADILFLIQQAQIRSSETRKLAVEDWKEIVKNAYKDENKNVNVEIQAYASPDGGLELNEKLAADRERNTSNYVKKELRRQKVDTPVNAFYTAQDWDGFRKLLEESNVQDKELVLRVLEMYPDPEVREREIKNISSVFGELANVILPKLRRSRLVANVEVIGKSDEELAKLGKEDPKSLNAEELLYSATLYGDDATKRQIYTVATQLWPKDARAYNNLGMLDYKKGDFSGAAAWFGKALNIDAANQSALMNLGLLSLGEGDLSGAEKYIGNAGSLPELNSALGLLYLKQGKYAEAAKLLSNEASNNGVLAQILALDYSKALELLKGIATPDATTHYLKAIVGARSGQTDLVKEGLTAALSADKSIARKIAMDGEFAKYISEPFFRSLLGL